MAVHLLKNGYEVEGFDIDKNLVEPLLEFGITKANSLKDFGNDKSIIISGSGVDTNHFKFSKIY